MANQFQTFTLLSPPPPPPLPRGSTQAMVGLNEIKSLDAQTVLRFRPTMDLTKIQQSRTQSTSISPQQNPNRACGVFNQETFAKISAHPLTLIMYTFCDLHSLHARHFGRGLV